ncbi:KamA family radical SAM protein [Nanoarchaeota archaeon]
MDYKEKLKQNITNIDELKEHIKLTKKEESLLKQVTKIHPLSITRHYLSLINKDYKKDPIRKLMIPSKKELDETGLYDPCDEKRNVKTSGLQHKYNQTALILSTNRCAAYCRFCFRKRLVGVPNKEILNRFDSAVKYIKKHKEINNVLISGGDPLILPTEIIEKFLKKLSSISHLNFIRFGSRVPVTFPDRIVDDPSLLKVFKKYSVKNKRIRIITHFNHPREITEKSIKAIDQLMHANVIVGNQTVLLKGVNDSSVVLAELLNKLTSIGVRPYYVFQCRPVKRVKGHFQVPLHKGYNIVESAKKKLNGLGKGFRFIMSHKTGKIEIVGVLNDEMYFKYHQARSKKDLGRLFKKKIDKKLTWLN